MEDIYDGYGLVNSDLFKKSKNTLNESDGIIKTIVVTDSEKNFMLLKGLCIPFNLLKI